MKKLLLSIMLCMMMMLIAGCEKTSKEASNMEGENGNENGIQNEEINLDDYTGIFQSTNCDSNAAIEKDGDNLKLTFDLYDVKNVNFTSGTLVVSKSDMLLDNGMLYVRPNNASGYQY
ncbi:MAG: hypothetical protein MJ246_07790 [Clostridia bacterium]|nr:hypothetical protein [Clostridia bacterium]